MERVHIAALFLHLRHAIEFQQGGAAGGFGSHAGAAVFVGQQIEVSAEFRIQLGFGILPAEELHIDTLYEAYRMSITAKAEFWWGGTVAAALFLSQG